MAEEPSHVKQPYLIHVCKIGWRCSTWNELGFPEDALPGMNWGFLKMLYLEWTGVSWRTRAWRGRWSWRGRQPGGRWWAPAPCIWPPASSVSYRPPPCPAWTSLKEKERGNDEIMRDLTEWQKTKTLVHWIAWRCLKTLTFHLIFLLDPKWALKKGHCFNKLKYTSINLAVCSNYDFYIQSLKENISLLSFPFLLSQRELNWDTAKSSLYFLQYFKAMGGWLTPIHHEF